MKKLLLIPTAIFPYSFCLCLAYGFGTGHFSGDPVMSALGIVSLLCFFLALMCNIAFIIIAGKFGSKELLKTALILKAIHIPAYLFIFIIGLLMGTMFFMTFPLILFLIFADGVTLFLSSMISIFSLIKNLKDNRYTSIGALICQFFFCADIISLFILSLTVKNGQQNKVLFKLGSALQVIYCLGCLIVIICMPISSAYYTTEFGRILFLIGEVLIILSTLNPMPLICLIMNLVSFFTTDLKKSKKALAWIIISPILIVSSWLFAVLSFVSNGGSV